MTVAGTAAGVGTADADEGLVAAVRTLLADAAGRTPDPADRAVLEQARDRLSGPVRLAFAGRVKAGKSTLLNALVGEELAPTDAGECTKVVTWYVGADRPEVVLHAKDGSRAGRPYRRDGGPVDVDLGRPAEEVDHLEIRWPSARLRGLTLIDTPGIASLSRDVSRRAEVLLDEAPVADAVVYLLRHAHATDVRFLESFTHDELVRGSAANALGILSRADEIGSCRLDALDVAAAIARRYEQDPRVHRLCPVVLPVAGLLAQAAGTLREEEYRILERVAALPPATSARLLLSADRFVADDPAVAVTAVERSHLVDRLGLFGVRYCLDLVRRDRVASANDLAVALRASSGLDRLRSVVLAQFGQRARLLVCRSAVLTLRSLLRRGAVLDAARFEARVEELTASAHGFVEVSLLDDVRSGVVEVPARLAPDLERLLGGSGAAPTARLGLTDDASPEQVREAALAALARWQRIAESPMSTRAVQVAARAATRTCEGLLA